MADVRELCKTIRLSRLEFLKLQDASDYLGISTGEFMRAATLQRASDILEDAENEAELRRSYITA